MAQDEDFDLTRDVVALAAPGDQTQQAADGKVDKRQQHRALQEEGVGSLRSYSAKLLGRTCREFANLSRDGAAVVARVP